FRGKRTSLRRVAGEPQDLMPRPPEGRGDRAADVPGRARHENLHGAARAGRATSGISTCEMLPGILKVLTWRASAPAAAPARGGHRPHGLPEFRSTTASYASPP